MRCLSSGDADRCPFADNPDVTGCDCDCALVRPKGRGPWAAIRRLFASYACTSGPGGCGDGSLPCRRFDEWSSRRGEVAVDG